MYRPKRESFVIQIRDFETLNQDDETLDQARSTVPLKLNVSAMKLFNRFRKILMRFLFSIPSDHHGSSSSGTKQNNCDRFDPPKTSCSSYYSSQSHYTEAIADCIEFFNKSAQEGILDGRKSDVLFWSYIHMLFLIKKNTSNYFLGCYILSIIFNLLSFSFGVFPLIYIPFFYIYTN